LLFDTFVLLIPDDLKVSFENSLVEDVFFDFFKIEIIHYWNSVVDYRLKRDF